VIVYLVIVNSERGIVKQEIATLFSRRIDQKTAIHVVDILEEFEIININAEMETQIWTVFKSFKKKNISFIDCCNLYLADKNLSNISPIFSTQF
jgi:predicted nucleic acid-binding protein